ncbi:phycobiliprotein lyase [Chamaesiphon sp. VAR_69_metabat_338]|uniref:phycobiliprotein lyase n=1 Tax=Chamaesiphon sp. VAR_69_metabat_338 TaxID=2964704 RepID=UPI00286EB46C|nr:phycobiliprotein lyase [Chamaesiphon sp. VAR_69_metabat_338]
MNVREFFELSAGKWFSQKTSQHLTLKQSEQGKSDLVIEILPPDHPQAIDLCQRAGIEPSAIWGGVKYSWKGTIAWDTQPQSPTNRQGETIAISVPDATTIDTGKLIYATSGDASAPRVASYTLGEDEALTLISEGENISSEERVWFESNNVRLRTTIVTQPSGESIASFYSEIRMGG